MQQVLQALRTKNVERRGNGLPPRYWVVEDIDEFFQEFRATAAEVTKHPWATDNFTTMYEALKHNRLLDGCMHAAAEAWSFMEQRWAKKERMERAESKLILGNSS